MMTSAVLDQPVVGSEDGIDVTGDAGAERGVVGADVSVIGA